MACAARGCPRRRGNVRRVSSSTRTYPKKISPPAPNLALMRRGLDTRAYELWEMCRFYTFKVDDDEARRGRVSREQEAEHAALALYGLHQQSKRTSMHRPGIGLGVALRRLRNHGKFSADAIDARVTAAATTIDPDALLLRLRGLVDLLRTIDQPLDYERLIRGSGPSPQVGGADALTPPVEPTWLGSRNAR